MSADTTPDNFLFEWYGRYIGDPDTETDVYLGFALFFGGLALGAIGIAVFLLSAALGGEPGFTFALREVAVVAAGGGLPLLLFGIVVLLPGDERMTYVGLAGLAVCVLAGGVFVWAYPMNWNVTGVADYSAQGVALYAVGVVAVVGSTGAALVGHQVERAAGPAMVDADEANRTGPDVTDEQVRRDIDDAMAGADISWGGVSSAKTKRLKLNTDAVDDIERTNIDSVSAKTTRAEGANVDDAVTGLRELQGREHTKTGTGGGTDDQIAALQELRNQQQAQELATANDGLLDRVKSLLTRS